MNTIYKKYVDKYGNFLYILNIEFDHTLGYDEKNIILYDIYNFINDKYITKNIFNTDISIKWRVYDNTHLEHYYTDANEILSDKGVYEHTKLLVNDFQKIKNSHKFKIYITKPLTKYISIM